LGAEGRFWLVDEEGTEAATGGVSVMVREDARSDLWREHLLSAAAASRREVGEGKEIVARHCKMVGKIIAPAPEERG